MNFNNNNQKKKKMIARPEANKTTKRKGQKANPTTHLTSGELDRIKEEAQPSQTAAAAPVEAKPTTKKKKKVPQHNKESDPVKEEAKEATKPIPGRVSCDLKKKKFPQSKYPKNHRF